MQKRWRVFYKLKTHDVVTDWQEAHFVYDEIGVDPPPAAYIEAPDGLFQAIHWRGRQLSKFFKPILTPVTELYELKFCLDEETEEIVV